MWKLSVLKNPFFNIFTLELAKVEIQDITSEEFHLNGHNKPSYKTPSHPYPNSHSNQPSSSYRCNEANMKTHVSSYNMPPKMQDLGVTENTAYWIK